MGGQKGGNYSKKEGFPTVGSVNPVPGVLAMVACRSGFQDVIHLAQVHKISVISLVFQT